jgi:predicted nucleotidyltransferase
MGERIYNAGRRVRCITGFQPVIPRPGWPWYVVEGKAMITKEEILKTLAKDKPELQKRFKVSKMALFGSYARGDQQENSDVDILVEVDPSIGLEFVTLAERIEKLLGVSVDLVSSRAVNSRAMKYIEPELIYV